jgi:predicted nucleotidyltransferase component of viral defense system
MIAQRGGGRDEFRFSEFLRAAPRDRRDVFLGAATRLGTPEQNVEKAFWVAWTLDVLFNGLPAGHPRFLFKGGTSLSKAYGLISRFSEDIDITVFREDIGQAASVPELERLSRKKRQFKLEAIKNTCREYIQNTLAQQFGEVVRSARQLHTPRSEDRVYVSDEVLQLALRAERAR